VTVASLVARNANDAVAAPMVGFDGVWSQAVGVEFVRMADSWLQSL
jgi:hypothetical protein